MGNEFNPPPYMKKRKVGQNRNWDIRMSQPHNPSNVLEGKMYCEGDIKIQKTEQVVVCTEGFFFKFCALAD